MSTTRRPKASCGSYPFAHIRKSFITNPATIRRLTVTSACLTLMHLLVTSSTRRGASTSTSKPAISPTYRTDQSRLDHNSRMKREAGRRSFGSSLFVRYRNVRTGPILREVDRSAFKRSCSCRIASLISLAVKPGDVPRPAAAITRCPHMTDATEGRGSRAGVASIGAARGRPASGSDRSSDRQP